MALIVFYTTSFPNYNSFDRLVLLIFLRKNENFKAIFKVYYMLNNITIKLIIIMNFFNITS
jgi:hypothetical protein